MCPIVADDQYHEIISASDAWQIADDDPESEYSNSDYKTTNSARRVKALVEQITGNDHTFTDPFILN